MRTIVLVLFFVCISSLSGCAQPPQRPLPEVPGSQQYYQMPGNYYTAPPPRLEYWDPGQHPKQGKKMDFENNSSRKLLRLRNKIQEGGTQI